MRRCLLLLCFFAVGSLQGDPLPLCPQPIKLALHDYGLLYSKARGGGIDLDLVNALARRSGCQFEVRVMPRVRIWKMLEDGLLQMSTSGVLTAERAAYVTVIDVMALKNHMILRPQVEADSLAAFVADPRWRLGVIRGFSYGPGYDQMIALLRSQDRVDESNDFTQLYDKLAAGRFQATLSQSVNYHPELSRRGLLDKVRILDWMPDEPAMLGGLVLSRRHFSETEVAKWRAIFAAMRTDGSWRRILLGYLPAVEVELILQF